MKINRMNNLIYSLCLFHLKKIRNEADEETQRKLGEIENGKNAENESFY